MRNALCAIPSHLFEMDALELQEKIKRIDGADGLNNADMMRTSFWLEYNRAQRTQSNLQLNNVFSGVMFAASFNNKYLKNSFRLLYIITPPVDYQVHQHRILTMSFEQEQKILQMNVMKDVYNKDGDVIGEEIDTKLLSVQQKIAENIKNRIMGMPVNRSMQINQNFNSTGASYKSDVPEFNTDTDPDELQSIIDQLSGEKGMSPDNKEANVIDTTGLREQEKA